MIVCNLTTPAQYFHVLRRQVISQHKKPLILMTPKSMLRHPLAVSSIDDFSSGCFQHILDDKIDDKSQIRRLVLCSGKVYYDALSERIKQKSENIALIRIEQLYPLDIEKINEIINTYKNLKDIVWLQEEPQNMGGWNYIYSNLQKAINRNIEYIGRCASASVATGSYSLHLKEQSEIINNIFSNI